MAAVTIYSDVGAQKIKSVTISTVSPSICHEMMGLDDLSFLNAEFYQLFHSLSLSPTGMILTFHFRKLLKLTRAPSEVGV